MNTKSNLGKILDNTSSGPMGRFEHNITGGNPQIACEALFLALSIALRYSLASSNTLDMMRVLKSLSGEMPIPNYRGSEDHGLKTVIAEIKEGKKAKANLIYQTSLETSVVNLT